MAGKLTALAVERETRRGKYADGDGLYLIVAGGSKNWQFRYWFDGNERWHGLGSLKDVSLKQAREKRDAARQIVRAGIDVVQQKRDERSAGKQEEAADALPTFRQAAERYITANEGSWKNAKHRQQWTNSLKAYAFGSIGNKRVDAIKPSDIVDLLAPIWVTKRETANRVRGRIEIVLAREAPLDAVNYRNPAELTQALKLALPRRPKRRTAHHAALPYSEMPAFWRSLAADQSDAAKMLRFIILTACRFNEAAFMTAAEVAGNLWTIPDVRMKAGRPHEVPLTTLAIAQLPFRPVSDVTLAKCIARHTNSKATTHGFRSTFRDWAGDMTDFPRDIAEMALAHEVGDDTEAAYRRGTALAKRRQLMEAWAQFCLSKIARAAA